MFGFGRHTPGQNKPGAKARRRRRWYRRWTRYLVWSALFLLVSGIIAYNIITQDHRIKAFLEQQLSHASGAHVSIGSASFSILSGLHVENVNVRTNQSPAADAPLLTAGNLNVLVDYSSLLHLQIPRPTILEARKVDLSLIEDVEEGTWNFEKLLSASREPSHRPESDLGDREIVPTVFLRDARVRYYRKEAGKVTEAGKIQVQASVYPMSPRHYGFSVIAQPPGTTRTTSVYGAFDANAATIDGRISALQFDDALRRMMPTEVRQWMERLDLSGQISIPRFSYKFGPPKDAFDITLAFHNVQSTVQPGQWLNDQEHFRRAILHESIALFDRMGMDQPLNHGELVGDSDEDAWPRSVLEYLRMHMRMVPLSLKQLQGTVRFTADAIELNGVHFQLQGQSFVMNGRLNGYAGNAPGEIRVQTEPDTFLKVPPDRQFMNWLPDDIHKVYLQFRPEGKARLDVQLVRSRPGAGFEPTVIVEMFDSQFAFEDFPYPLQRCNGRIVFARDESSGEDLVKIVGLTGHGLPGSPNAGKSVEINATVGPFAAGGVGVDVRVEGQDITSEPAIREAFPREIAKAMLIFGPPDYGARQAAAGKPPQLTPEELFHWPEFYGDFKAHVHRDPGPNKGIDTDVSLDLKKATGSLRVFPYPMHDIACRLRILDDDVNHELQVHSVTMDRGGATLKMSGKVEFEHERSPVMPDLNVEALNVPIDDDLLNALPPTERGWLRKAALQGRVDIVGRVFRDPPGTPNAPDTNFGLALRLHDAMIYRDSEGPAATNLNGDLYLVPGRLDLKSVTGRRGNAQLHFAGYADWETPDVQLQLNARNLLLDRPLREILPSAAQESWAQQRPEGTTDVDLDFSLTKPKDATGQAPDALDEHVRLALRPQKLSITSDSFPYRLDDLGGEVIVDGRNIQFKHMTGRHGPAQVSIDGSGTTGSHSSFDLKIHAQDLAPDKELLAAVPSALADILTGLKAGGAYTVDFDKFNLRDSDPKTATTAPTQPSSEHPTTQPATRPVDLDFSCSVATDAGSLDIGVPVTALNGSVQLTGEVRRSELTKLDGTITSDSFKLMDRDGGCLSATIRRPQYSQNLMIESLRSDLAGGVVSGGLTIISGNDQPSRYAADIVIRNADVMQIAGEALSKPIRGQFSADLGVEGTFGDVKNRHGRGMITIDGEDMYEAPIVLGFFRLVNFALPVQQGVRNIRLSYVLNGDVVTFDTVEMSSPGLRIYGDGKLDFNTRQMSFTLNTENPDALSLPIIGTLTQKLRQELLQIKIAGTLQEPKVKTTSFPTFQATLGQVIEDVQRKRK